MAQTLKKSSRIGPATSWWQFAIVYPLLAVALASAIPTWRDVGFSAYHQIELGSVGDAVKQRDFWINHPLCTASKFDWFETADSVKIDGTICPNGNIFLRLKTAGKNYARGLYLDDLINDAGFSSAGDVLGLKAYAAETVERKITEIARGGDGDIAQATAIVECQAFLGDDRTVVRRVRVGFRCFDEKIDTFTGEVTETRPVNCAERCRGRL